MGTVYMSNKVCSPDKVEMVTLTWSRRQIMMVFLQLSPPIWRACAPYLRNSVSSIWSFFKHSNCQFWYHHPKKYAYIHRYDMDMDIIIYIQRYRHTHPLSPHLSSSCHVTCRAVPSLVLRNGAQSPEAVARAKTLSEAQRTSCLELGGPLASSCLVGVSQKTGLEMKVKHWWVVWIIAFMPFHILGISSSQLTKSYFSEG
jgi:hypothetical protein